MSPDLFRSLLILFFIGDTRHTCKLTGWLRAPLAFFTGIETGVLVNRYNAPKHSCCEARTKSFFRFSQDLRHVDITLPASIINCGFRKSPDISPRLTICPCQLTKKGAELTTCLVSVALSVNAVGYFAAILPLIIAALYAVQGFYLRTSRQLRLLE